MAKLPIVAIIGRPNTGKSTLFNRLIGERRAIESAVPGTTRDHISHRMEFGGIPALLLDTGGIGKSRDTDFEKSVAAQSLLALEHADIIILTISGRDDLTSDDRKVIDAIRKKRKRFVGVIVAVTKVDTPGADDEVLADFCDVIVGDHLLAVSAAHRLGIDELSETIAEMLTKRSFKKASNEQDKPDRPPRIAIVGKPNVGKSSIVNALLPPERKKASPRVVSPIAGTTRDATDIDLVRNGKTYTLVDTAGLKKHRLSLDELERLSMLRTVTAIEDADIAALVLDASEPVSQQDKRIAALAIESGKGIVILLNKIDLLSGDERKRKLAETMHALAFCSRFAKIIPCSAETREGLLKIFDVFDAIQRNRTRRIPAAELRRWFETAVHGQPLGAVGSTKHIVQASDIPPTFVLFVKNPKAVKVSQLRYLDNRLREMFGFDGTPVRWITKK